MASLSTYLTQDGENVFDLAVKLFGRADALQSLIRQFPGLDTDPAFNSIIEYIPESAIESNAKQIPITRILTSNYLTRDLQSVYDLSVQLYGDVSKIGILLELFPNLDSNIDLNSSIQVSTQIDPIALFFNDNRIIVATDIEQAPIIYSRVLREDGSFALREDGSYILRETA